MIYTFTMDEIREILSAEMVKRINFSGDIEQLEDAYFYAELDDEDYVENLTFAFEATNEK